MTLVLDDDPAAGHGDGKTACITGATTDDASATALAAADVAADFVDCYRSHYPRVVRALELSGTSPGAAEDLAQEAFARSFVHWRRVRRGTNPPGYVYRVAFRLARRSHRLPLEEALPPEERGAQAGAPDVAEEATLRTSAASAIAAMPAARRACAVLCLLAGLPTREAARALGIKESTVRKQLERARADLRRAVAYAPSTPLGQDTPVPPRPQ